MEPRPGRWCSRVVGGWRRRWFLPLLLAVAVGIVVGVFVSVGRGTDNSSRSARVVSLTCADESPPSGAPGSSAVRLGAVALDGIRSWRRTAPSGISLAYRHKQYRLLKAFAYILPKPPARVTVRVVKPRTGVRLFYVAGDVWASRPSPRHIVTASASAVTFSACKGPTGYTGGLLIRRAACVTLTIGQTGRSSRTARIPIAPARCH